MKLEHGKFYHAEDGQKIGPMSIWDYLPENNWWHQGNDKPGLWKIDGNPWTSPDLASGTPDSPKLVAEWTEPHHLVPTWSGLLPLLLFTLESGTDTGKRLAREEFARMAQAADRE